MTLLFPQPKLLSLPRFKICKQCGAVCESAIEICPGLIPSQKLSFWEISWRKFLRKPKRINLALCGSSDFQYITCDRIRKGTGVYFRKWPIWPSEKAWHQPSEKDSLEESRKTKKPTD
jgi:hypothetical protein